MEIKKNLISTSCLSSWIYFDSIFNTPLAWSLFLDDYSFLKFCENYDYYVNLVPKLRLADKNEYFSNQLPPNHPQIPYVVLELDDIIIHWIHTDNIDETLDNWKRRLERSKDCEKIFIHITPEFKKIYTENERKNIINRFRNLNGFKILLTEKKDEEVDNETCVIKCFEGWVGKSQEERTNNGDCCIWYDQKNISNVIYEILKSKNKLYEEL